MKPTLNLDHRQRSPEARRCRLRTSKNEIFIRLLIQLQNQRKQSLLRLISDALMMQMRPRARAMLFFFTGSPFVRMLYRSRTGLFRNLGSEGVQERLCCKSSWKMYRAGPEIERQGTGPHSRASFRCLRMRSPQQTGKLTIDEIR